MFHPIVIRQETEAQCAGDEAPGQRGFHRPRPRPQVRVAPSPAHDLRQSPCVLLPSLGAALAPPHGGRVRSVPAAAWTPARVAPPSLQTAAWGRAPPPRREVQTGRRRRRWAAAGPPGSSPAGGRGLCGWGWGRPPNRRAPDTQQRAQPCLESLGTDKHLSQPGGSRHNKFTANSFRGRGQVTIRGRDGMSRTWGGFPGTSVPAWSPLGTAGTGPAAPPAAGERG